MNGRDARGRFVSGNELASIGGRARAAALTPERRREIAKSGLQGLAAKRFDGDVARATAWLSDRGVWSNLFGEAPREHAA